MPRRRCIERVSEVATYSLSVDYRFEWSGFDGVERLRKERGHETRNGSLQGKMASLWSIADYCEDNVAEALHAAALKIPVSSREFLKALDLPSVHPFCQQGDMVAYFHGAPGNVPPMGPMEHRFQDESWLEEVVTIWFMVAPPLLAMAELWIRLFAGILGPVGCTYLVYLWIFAEQHTYHKGRDRSVPQGRLALICLLTVAGSLVLMTDKYYVLNNGPVLGAVLFVVAVGLALITCQRHHLNTASLGLWLLVLLAVHLVWDVENDTLIFGGKQEQVLIPEGLYYDSSNPFVRSVVEHWPAHFRNYSVANGATPWLPSGDSRTGIPFLLNHNPSPKWHRVFLLTLEDEEYVALDVTFPVNGFQKDKPVYLILHGLNGGSKEEYIRDFALRRIEGGSTVVVMVARGLMDLPVRGWHIFHGARTSDAHAAALALRRTLGSDQVLIGVGYSMGAIVMNNYVASYGSDCVLDGAIAVSGGLDMRFQEHFYRAQRLWQPILAEELRSHFLLGKFGIRVHERLSRNDMLRVMRATHVTDIDLYAIVPYNGFRDLADYYMSMSALGDIPLNDEGLPQGNTSAKVHSISIPLLVVQAFDDPLITWRASAQNEGFMHPNNLTRTGSGNLMLLLTKAGGHVGWPTGLLPTVDKWKWMSNLVGSFGQAVSASKRTQEDK